MSRDTKSRGNEKSGLGYFLREGIAGILLHGFMSFAAVTVIAACLLITCTFTLVAYNIDLVIGDLEKQSEIIVYINDKVERSEALSMGEKIKMLTNVESVSFVTKEQAFDDYLDTLGDNAYVMEDLAEEKPLRDSYRVIMKDISLHEQTVKELEEIAGVEGSNSSKEVSDRLIQIRGVVNLVSYTLIGLLGGVSVFIIANTVKLAMFARREEIAVMRMVGATNHFIRAPFVVEGIVLGITAAVLAFFAIWGVYGYVTGALTEGTAVLAMVPFGQFKGKLIAILLAAGLVMGTGGSVFTIRKFLKV